MIVQNAGGEEVTRTALQNAASIAGRWSGHGRHVLSLALGTRGTSTKSDGHLARGARLFVEAIPTMN